MRPVEAEAIEQVAPGWDQWHCKAYDSRTGKTYRGECFVRASDSNIAKQVAKRGFQIIGIKGRLRITASKYFPWLDLRIQSYVGIASD